MNNDLFIFLRFQITIESGIYYFNANKEVIYRKFLEKLMNETHSEGKISFNRHEKNSDWTECYLEIKNLLVAFILLIFGVILSLIVIFTEIVVHRFKSNTGLTKLSVKSRIRALFLRIIFRFAEDNKNKN